MLGYLAENAVAITAIVGGIVTIGSQIAALTPTPKDDSFFRGARKVLDLVAGNYGHAKNRENPR